MSNENEKENLDIVNSPILNLFDLIRQITKEVDVWMTLLTEQWRCPLVVCPYNRSERVPILFSTDFFVWTIPLNITKLVILLVIYSMYQMCFFFLFCWMTHFWWEMTQNHSCGHTMLLFSLIGRVTHSPRYLLLSPPHAESTVCGLTGQCPHFHFWPWNCLVKKRCWVYWCWGPMSNLAQTHRHTLLNAYVSAGILQVCGGSRLFGLFLWTWALGWALYAAEKIIQMRHRGCESHEWG